MKRKYQASDSDLPSIFHDTAQRSSPMTTAKLRIHSVAKTMSIEISPDELEKFALLLIALEQE